MIITPKPYKLWSLDDVFDLDPPEYIMDYWLLKGGKTVVWGKYGSGKSLLSLEWSIHLALGRDWSGYEISEPVKVLYIYAEGASNLQERVAAWVNAHGFITVSNLLAATEGRLQFLDVDPGEPDINLKDEKVVERIRETVGAFQPDLIIFDPVAKLWPGIDNNIEAEVGAMLQTVDAVRQGATALIVTHARKDQASYRGVTTLPDLVDVMASIEKITETEGGVKLEITPTGDGHKHKFRDPSVKKFFQLERVSIGPSEHPKMTPPRYAVYLKHLAGTPAGGGGVRESVIVEFVPGHTFSPKQIKESMGLPSGSKDSSQVGSALSELVADGYLRQPKRGEYELTEKGERWLSSLSVTEAVTPSASKDLEEVEFDE